MQHYTEKRKIGNDCVYVQMNAPKNETEVSSKPKKTRK